MPISFSTILYTFLKAVLVTGARRSWILCASMQKITENICMIYWQ